MTEKTINALERAIHLAEYVCSDYCDVEITTIKNAIDIMKSQKSEIEKLQLKITELQHRLSELGLYDLQVEVSKKIEKEIKAEAIKEFAERLKTKKYGGTYPYVLVNDIDNLTKELTEKDTSVSLIDGHIEAEKGR